MPTQRGGVGTQAGAVAFATGVAAVSSVPLVVSVTRGRRERAYASAYRIQTSADAASWTRVHGGIGLSTAGRLR